MSLFAKKRTLVVGLDPSGQAACRLLLSLGAEVTAVPWQNAAATPTEWRELAGQGVKAGTPQGGYDFLIHSSAVSASTAEVETLARQGLPILSDLELAQAEFYCLALAVTGTNGKSTTAELIQQILEQAHRKTVKAGGSGMAVCEAAGKTKELDFITLEVNSFQLESVDQFRPAVAVLLNLTPDHMDRYDRMSKYARTLARVFQNQQVFDWAIIQSEALAHLRSLGLKIPSKIITFSANNRHADLWLDRGLIISRMDGWTGPLFDVDHATLRGPHNAENMMAAFAVGHVLRIPLEQMVSAARTYQPGPHRLEQVAEVDGVRFINNSKAMNAAAAAQSIEAIAPGRGGEPNIWLIAGGKDKGLEYHDLGPLLARRVKGAFLIGETREKLRSAWSLFTPCAVVDSLLEAVLKAAEAAVPGDVVLLSPACSSFDMFESYQHRGEVFRQAVQTLAKTPEAVASELTAAGHP